VDEGICLKERQPPVINKNKPHSEYILSTGGQGASNLDLQHELFKETSFAQLKKAGLAPGMVVWDVGCGSGAMTEHLAKTVGNEGLVYAIDISEDQIRVAQSRIAAAGHQNVQFIVEDINTLDSSSYKKADIVYSRFLLMHVRDPQKIIKFMASLLKPGGVVALHESSMNTPQEHENDPSIRQYYKLVTDYGTLKDFDYTIGRKLQKICEDLGIFSKLNCCAKTHPTTDGIKELLALRLDELQDQCVSSGLISEEDYTSLKRDVNAFLNCEKSNNCMIVAEQSHVLAYK
jgi:ubiquinone/menaquinone biosynthesis C-methylase UbiE